jgi:hypothetical protein
MQGKQQVRRDGKAERARVVESSLTPLSRGLPLPAWESFPEQDRHRLVHALLQAAQRQVEKPWPMRGLLRK